MKPLRKLLELTLFTTMIGSLFLTSCGGGGGGGGASGGNAPSPTSLTLTPVKGKFQGKCVVTVGNTVGQTLFIGVQSINAAGATDIALPAGSMGPFVISFSGTTNGSCLYFNDSVATPQWVAMNPSESLNALVLSSQLTASANIAVTSVTEMAYQATSAVNNGSVRGLHDGSPEISQGIAAAVSLTGLTGASSVASIFTPPLQLPQPGKTPNDDMGRALVNIANLNSARPLDAVKYMSYYAAEAAHPAMATYYQHARAALNIQPEAQEGRAFAVRVAASSRMAGEAANSARHVTAFLNDLSSSNGLRDVKFGYATPSHSVPSIGSVIKATLKNERYTITRTSSTLVNQTWTQSGSNQVFVLTNEGWSDTNSGHFHLSLNQNGTAHMTQDGYGSVDLTFGSVGLAGLPFSYAVLNNMMSDVFFTTGGLDGNGQLALNANGAPTATNVIPTGKFTAGAMSYALYPADYSINPASPAFVGTSQDIYELVVSPLQSVTTPNHAALTQLTDLESPFCIHHDTNYVRPNSQLGTLDIFSTNGHCVAPAFGALPLFSVPLKKVRLHEVDLVEWTLPNSNGSFATEFIAMVNGALYVGWKTPAGSPFPWGNEAKRVLNDTAAQQLLTALGLPLL